MNKLSPELNAVLDQQVAALEAERAAIHETLAPLQQKRDAILDQLQPLENTLREVNRQIKAIEVPRLREIGNDLAAIARTQGAHTLSNDRPDAPEKG